MRYLSWKTTPQAVSCIFKPWLTENYKYAESHRVLFWKPLPQAIQKVKIGPLVLYYVRERVSKFQFSHISIFLTQKAQNFWWLFVGCGTIFFKKNLPSTFFHRNEQNLWKLAKSVIITIRVCLIFTMVLKIMNICWSKYDIISGFLYFRCQLSLVFHVVSIFWLR